MDSTATGISASEQSEKIDRIISHLSQYLQGKDRALNLALTAFFSKGHLLIEDLPGLGKTTLAVGIARALGLSFGRVQCTSDLLPSDITGLSIYNKTGGEFEFHPGPIFNNIVLVDEINRATPKTQSALLEAMAEEQVTIEGRTYKLPKPFFVIATQNPVEHFGTFPLPESQMDRFIMRISIGYPSRDSEKEILRGGSRREGLYLIEPIMDMEEVVETQDDIRKTYISDKMLDYLLNIINATRHSKYLTAGLSTRGGIAITYTAKTRAFFNGRDYIIPEDIKELSEHTITHRIMFKEEYDNLDKKEIVKSLIDAIEVPA
jgi:MoxR-like ATPase